MSKLIANTFRHTAASSDAITLDSSGNITFNGTVTGDNDTVYDDSSLRKDLATLALQTAVDTNRKAYNLNNSFIDQFEDDTGIGTETNVDRNASEYVSSMVTATTYFAPPLLEVAHGNANIEPATSTWTGGGVTNDRYFMKWNNTSPNWYPAVGVNELWDLGDDFTFRIFFNTDAGDIATGREHNSFSVIFTTDTGKAAGSNPSDVWATPALSANEIDGSPSFDNWFVNPYANSSNADFGAITDAADHNWAHSGTATERTLTYANAGSGGGVYSVGHYWQAAQTGDSAGMQFTYTKSNNTMTCKLMTDTSRSTLYGDNHITINGLPSAGRCLFIIGNADSGTGTDCWATTYNGGSTSDYSSKVAETTSATGTLASNKLNGDSVSRTKVSGVVLYKEAVGDTTLGTDFKIYFTCNGGTNWSEVTDRSTGSDFSTGIKTLYLNETTCTAGTDVRYKVEWVNQSSGSKETQLHGIGVNW